MDTPPGLKQPGPGGDSTDRHATNNAITATPGDPMPDNGFTDWTPARTVAVLGAAYAIAAGLVALGVVIRKEGEGL